MQNFHGKTIWKTENGMEKSYGCLGDGLRRLEANGTGSVSCLVGENLVSVVRRFCYETVVIKFAVLEWFSRWLMNEV